MNGDIVHVCVCVCVFSLCVNLASMHALYFILSCANCFFHFIHVQAKNERDVTAQFIMWALLGSRTASFSGEQCCTSPPPPVLLITVPPFLLSSHTHTHTHTHTHFLCITAALSSLIRQREVCASAQFYFYLSHSLAKSSLLTVVSYTP